MFTEIRKVVEKLQGGAPGQSGRNVFLSLFPCQEGQMGGCMLCTIIMINDDTKMAFY